MYASTTEPIISIIKLQNSGNWFVNTFKFLPCRNYDKFTGNALHFYCR